MSIVNDDDMTAEEFDARALAGESAQINVHVTHPTGYTFTCVSKTGISAARIYGPVVTSSTGAGAGLEPLSA